MFLNIFPSLYDDEDQTERGLSLGAEWEEEVKRP